MRLFYHSFDASRGRFVVGAATSPDGFKWTKKGIVFDPVAEGATSGSHDASGAAALQVVSKGGELWIGTVASIRPGGRLTGCIIILRVVMRAHPKFCLALLASFLHAPDRHEEAPDTDFPAPVSPFPPVPFRPET